MHHSRVTPIDTDTALAALTGSDGWSIAVCAFEDTLVDRITEQLEPR